VLQELAAYHLANQKAKQAIDYIEKAIPLDQLNEELYCQGMRAYSMLNDRAGFMRLYSDLKLILKNELNTTPMPGTETLYKELIGGS